MERVELRTVPRFFLNPSLNGFARGSAVRIIDLSVKGARLEVTTPLTPGEELRLSLLAEGREIAVKATALWCQIDSLELQTNRDRYLAGLVFAQQSWAVEELLDELRRAGAAIPIEDTRSHDRYLIGAPLTASFGDFSPVAIVDVSAEGARIATPGELAVGTTAQLAFQVDEEGGPVSVTAQVVWSAPAIGGDYYAGLLIPAAAEVMRSAIQRLCHRGEARIDLDSLRRKFDSLRVEARQRERRGYGAA